MSAQIRRSDYPDYRSYMNAIAAPIGGAELHIVWDEDDEVWRLEREEDDSNGDVSATS